MRGEMQVATHYAARLAGRRANTVPAGAHADAACPLRLCSPMLTGMFTVTEAESAAIRRVFEEEGELSAMIELRRYFPGIMDNAKARECARRIAGWQPPPGAPMTVTWLRPGGKR